ncbi:hypothetical protein [Parapedobacter tibetensis]|nr:hypothetical protein [Parapedobacter tibetensis]
MAAFEMQRRVYNMFVMSYRLYQKGRSFDCDTPTPEKLSTIAAGNPNTG